MEGLGGSWPPLIDFPNSLMNRTSILVRCDSVDGPMLVLFKSDPNTESEIFYAPQRMDQNHQSIDRKLLQDIFLNGRHRNITELLQQQYGSSVTTKA